MASSPSPLSPPLGPVTDDHDSKPLDASNNSSGNSTVSSVLIRSTKPSDPQQQLLSSDQRPSASCLSSASSQRVRIKAKNLRKVKSPFEEDGQSEKTQDEYVPPALPGNLPADYMQKRDTADVLIHGERGDTVYAVNHQKMDPQVEIDGSGISSLLVAHKDNAPPKSVPGEEKSDRKRAAESSLKQGAPTSTHAILSEPSDASSDVRITQFAAGGKQKVFKEQLLKRQENSVPIKRHVRLTMVGSDPGTTQASSRSSESKVNEDISNPNTLAAVTAAAVAATVPIVKAQTDLESKIDVMMERLTHLQELTDKAQQPLPQHLQQQQEQQAAAAVAQLSDQASNLHRDLNDVVSRRLQQLEKIQERQLEWQERLLMTNQHPAQGQERHSSLTQPHHLRYNEMVKIGGRSGITPSPIPGRGQTAQSHQSSGHGQQPFLSEYKHTYNEDGHQTFHLTLSEHTLQPEGMQPIRDYEHQRADSHKVAEPNAQKHRHYAPAITLHRYPLQHDSQPKQKGQAQGALSSDNDVESGFGKVAQQSSPLDTPAPRRHAPRPLTQNPPPKMTRAGRGLLKEILTSHDEEEKRMATRGHQIQSPQSTVIRGETSSESGAERKAASLLQQLSKLKTDMTDMKTDLLQNLRTHSKSTKAIHVVEENPVQLLSSRRHSELHEEAERDWDKMMERRLQPAPMDNYLRRKPPSTSNSTPVSSQPKLPLSPSQYNALVQPSLCAEAKAVLDKVQSSRACLKTNLEAVVRAKEQEEFYNYLDSMYLEGEVAERARLRYKVGRMIAALDEEIKHEFNQPRKPHSSAHIPERDSSGGGPGKVAGSSARSGKAGGKKRPVSARIDSGLKRAPPTSGEGGRAGDKQNKENVAQPKKTLVTRAKKQPAFDHNEDEAYLTRVYGKALYQARRSTMKKEPYLKYTSSSPWSKPARTPSAAQVKGTEMKSAKIQTEQSSRSINIQKPANQFYYQSYPVTTSDFQPQAKPAPIHTAPVHQPLPLIAPSHGQLIPMAVPLGPPQMGGLTEPVTLRMDGLEEGVVRELEGREVKTNVAVVSVQSKKKSQLTIQHLPPVDIDTEPPSPASSVTEQDEYPTRGTQNDKLEITPPDDKTLPGQSGPPEFSHYLAVADDVEPQDESEDEPPAPEISLPGHYQETRQPYHGPPFPPQAPPSDPSRPGPWSEKLAGDIRKDIMENAAMEWIEQELMARMISELYSKQPMQVARPLSPDSSIASSANDSIVDTIGPAGLQLFVDAGQAVDHTLVSALVREVLEEKVTTALGQHDRDIPHEQPVPAPQEVATAVSKSPVPTPEVTPKPSPVHTPPRVTSRVATPLASPSEASPAESETESMKELALTRNTTTADEPIAAPHSPVTTPINTPPPSPPAGVTTPELSPRESPKLISVIDGSVITPTPTPQPVSPEPDIEESVVLPPSPEPVITEEEPVPSTPTPSLPTPSTPTTPSPSSVTTTQPTPSTETAGQTISEGEWLISVKSEGQVDDSTEDEPGAVALRRVSTSSSIDSTLMGAEDIEKDMQDEELSEGEISPPKRTPILHSQDPVIALLAHMRQRSDPSAAPTGTLPYHTASQTLNDTRSLGEVSVGQRPTLTQSSERLLFKEAYGARPPETTPRSEVTRRSPGEVSGEEQLETGRQPVDSTLRMSQLDGMKHDEPRNKQDTADTGQRVEVVPHPAPRIIQVVGKTETPSPEPLQKEVVSQNREEMDQRELESGGEPDDVDREEDTLQTKDGERLASRAPIPSNLFGTQTLSDLGTRTLTPDALNLEALLQSGYLSQTFSQSEGGTSDFEFTKPMDQPAGHTRTTRTPVHSTQTLTEDRLETPDQDPGAKMAGAMSFSVTLPSAVESPGVDLSQTISEGELPAADTTSDVSELSGGPL